MTGKRDTIIAVASGTVTPAADVVVETVAPEAPLDPVQA